VTELRALIVDFGGVLTSPLQDSMSAWAQTDGIDTADLRTALRDWLGTSYGDDAAINPIHALERGEMEVPDFERELASRLHTHDGSPVDPQGLMTRMFAGFGMQDAMTEAVRAVKRGGFATALLSNSWGNDYPREGWPEMFDVTVISGEVGMRKPDPEIYLLTARKLGLEPSGCVFVDDLMANVRAAVELGMVGIHHVSAQQTIEELEALLGLSLR
jgi:epoxide hydrolase-like predicted phosphatase